MDVDDMKAQVESIIPSLSTDSHKGQAGRVGVVGGCKQYTGAPYFAAISALKVGADLSHVFCAREASLAIKSYSPELIVHPILDCSDFSEEFIEHLQHLHSLVIGPGLGRDPAIFQSTRRVIELAKAKSVPLVFDADSLFFLNSAFDTIRSYRKAILTPNKIEFGRLYSAVTKSQVVKEYTITDVEELARLLGNVTIVKKGSTDVISNGETTMLCSEPGSLRRCGGQGDLLSGSLGTFSFWAHKSSDNAPQSKKTSCNAAVIAAFGACLLTRRCSYLAFNKFGRSTVTTDLVAEIHNAFSALFPTR